MWLPMLLICANLQASSCTVVTRNYHLVDTEKECIKVVMAKLKEADDIKEIVYKRPMCQQIMIGKGI